MATPAPHSLIQVSTQTEVAQLDKKGGVSHSRKRVKKKKNSGSKGKGKVGVVKEYYEHDHQECSKARRMAQEECSKARRMAQERAVERCQEYFLESMGMINGSNEHMWDDPTFEFPTITLESLLEQLKTTDSDEEED